MNRGVYSAATAMATAQQWLDVVANNLANASTTGFKRDGLTFNDGLVRQMAAAGGTGPNLGSIGSGSVVKDVYTDDSPGVITATGNALDVAIRTPHGAFAMQTAGGVRFTRDGSFQLDSQRRIVDKSGQPVLNRQLQPITLPQGAVTVAEDGSVTVADKVVDQIGVFDGSFSKQGGNVSTSANAQPIDTPQLVPRSLEASNVNAIEEMIAMIRLNRAFELAQKSVQSQDDSTERLVSSLQNR